MYKRILDKLICPNTGTSDLMLYSIELTRQNNSVKDLFDDKILLDDDIKSGVIFTSDNKYVYVIHEYIPILLNDTDQDLTHLNSIAQQLIKQLPNELANALQNTLNRITAQHKSADGEWNREEMKYRSEEHTSELQSREN